MADLYVNGTKPTRHPKHPVHESGRKSVGKSYKNFLKSSASSVYAAKRLMLPREHYRGPSHSAIRSLDNRDNSSTMDSCVLHPPTQFLSDNVISGVVQRTRKVSASDRQWAPPSPKRKRQDSGYTGSSELMMLAHSSHDAAKKTAEDALANVVTQDWFVEQQKHQREIRRVRQIRYRKKQQDYMTTLEENNRDLQQEILQLEKRRRAISAAVPSEKTLWNVAVEYFRVFRYGFRASDLTDNKSSVQLDFLRASMAPDVLYNAGRGVEAILKNWTYFSLWFKDVEVQLEGLKKNGQESLIAKTTTTFIITEKTVANVFPHLTGPNTDGVLASKLLGQKIVLQGSTRFDWDSGYGRVTSVISESDMLTPMLRVLGSLEDVSKVFEKSLISLTPYRGQLRMRS